MKTTSHREVIHSVNSARKPKLPSHVITAFLLRIIVGTPAGPNLEVLIIG